MFRKCRSRGCTIIKNIVYTVSSNGGKAREGEFGTGMKEAYSIEKSKSEMVIKFVVQTLTFMSHIQDCRFFEALIVEFF